MIVDEIVKIIDEKGLTQAQAAEYCGMKRQMLWDILNSYRSPRFCTVEKIMNGLGYWLTISSPDDVDAESLIRSLRETDLDYESVKKVLQTLGIGMNWIAMRRRKKK